ncbi:hypothetical protein [Lysobacter humi (ex Lee et al. 2017)]
MPVPRPLSRLPPACALATCALVPALVLAAAGAPQARAMPGPRRICIDDAPAPVAWVALTQVDATQACRGRVIPLDDIAGARARRHLRRHVRHDASPARDALREILLLLPEMPGVPLGLTWDDGIAVTAGDYRHAERRLAAYLRDPQAYARNNWAHEF